MFCVLIKTSSDSNSDGPFIVDDSNLLLSPKEFFSIAQENKFLGNFLILS